MSRRIQTSSPGSREIAQARLRQLTRAAVLAVTGATVAIGILVAQEHPGASSPHKGTTTGSGSTAGTGTTTGGSSSSGNSGNTGSTGSTGNTGNSGSTAPTSSSSTPAVTSGGTSR